ncbi:MAG: BMP family ABC transporter substrate-binding protein [Streptosporangiales bacterium]|nr:BMP family ABC transporter substrate-binding protein [Streptosporangiales bacterium]
MSVRRGFQVASIGLIAGLVLSACGEPPAESDNEDKGGDALKACMVLDVGGVDDKSFNEASWAGLQEAKKENSNIDISYVSSSSQTDYEPNLNAEVNKGCEVVISVGGLMADATKKVAGQHPDTHFAEVDAPSSGKNVYGMQFNTAQPAFQAGYLAAAMSKTGKVGTFGGEAIPPVTIFMDGYYEGVQYFNEQNDENVKVIGWNVDKQKGGTFTNSFTDKGKGKSIAQSFLKQDVDMIHPPSGGAGLGAGAAIQESGGDAKMIWYDTDGCVSAKEYCDFMLTSVTKHMTKAVKDYTLKAAKGSPPTGDYVGTLENGGVGLAPFHESEDDVPDDVKSDLEQIEKDIIAGKIELKSPSQPKAG